MGTQERLRGLPNSVQVTMDNVVLEEDNDKVEILLGCSIQSNLKWHHQIQNLVSKLKKRLAGLAHLRKVCPFQVRKQVTEGMFNSTLVYCLSLFGGMNKVQLTEVQILQNKAAKLVCDAPPRANRKDLFKKLDWLTFNQLVSYHTILTVYKIRMSQEPEYLSKLLRNDSRNDRIIIPNPNLVLTEKSFVFRGSNLWNELPQDIKNQVKISCFKKKMRKWVTENIPQFVS